MNKKYLILILTFAVSSCAHKSPTNNDNNIPPPSLNWKIALAPCNFEKENIGNQSSVVATALIGFAFDFIVSSFKKAISDAGNKKTLEFPTISNANYLLEPTRGNSPTTRACFVLGLGVPERPNLKKVYTQSTPNFNNINWYQEMIDNGSNDDTVKKMIKDMSLLQLAKKPRFMMRVNFFTTRNQTAIRPYVDYLYYPSNLMRGRKNKQSVAILIESILPVIKDGTIMSFLYFFPPSIQPRSNIYTKEEIRDNFDLNSDWIPIPAPWTVSHKRSYPSSYEFPVNVQGTVVVSAEGLKFAKRLSDSITKERTTEFTNALMGSITKDSEQIKEKAYEDYTAAITAFYKASSEFIDACSKPNIEARNWKYYAALQSYEVAKKAEKSLADDQTVIPISKPTNMCQ